MLYVTGKIYELSVSTTLAQSRTIALLVKGGSVNLDIVGSKELPTSLADMHTIAPEDAPFTEAGWLSFLMLPRYISFVGTADSVELSWGSLDDRGDIS